MTESSILITPILGAVLTAFPFLNAVVGKFDAGVCAGGPLKVISRFNLDRQATLGDIRGYCQCLQHQLTARRDFFRPNFCHHDLHLQPRE